MAQQLIDVGTVANDRTGDTWRAAFQKVNANETELFASVTAIGLQFIAQESDFSMQDGTTITLESSKVYVVTAAFSTAKQFVCQSGSAITSFNQFGPLMTYTGTAAMFLIADANFSIAEINITSTTATQIYSATDTVGSNFVFIQRSVNIVSCKKIGTFTDLLSVTSRFTQCLNADDGITISGTNGNVVTIFELALISTSATFKGVDFGSSTPINVELRDLLFVAPAGAFGISGLASSGNIPTGSIAEVKGCSFSGGMTDLQNIASTDIRWRFEDNFPTSDTITDAILSLTSNATETVIAASSTPVKVLGTFVDEVASLFTMDTTGRATYVGERDVRLPVDVNASVKAASGVNKGIRIYVALNGTEITNSGKSNIVDATDTRNTSIPWQLNFSENDYIEIFIENTTDTTNLIVVDAVLRVA